MTDPYAADEWNRFHIPDAMMVTVAAAPAFALATLRAGAVQIPAIGAAGAWPLAAAAPAGFAGLDSDIKGVLVNRPVAFPALQD